MIIRCYCNEPLCPKGNGTAYDLDKPHHETLFLKLPRRKIDYCSLFQDSNNIIDNGMMNWVILIGVSVLHRLEFGKKSVREAVLQDQLDRGNASSWRWSLPDGR